MKYFLFPLFSISIFFSAKANDKDSVVFYNLHDSVKAIQFMAEVKVIVVATGKEVFAGIKTDAVKLSPESDKNKRTIAFELSKSAFKFISLIRYVLYYCC